MILLGIYNIIRMSAAIIARGESILQIKTTVLPIKNYSLPIIIDDLKMDVKSSGCEIDMHLHIPNYDTILARYYPVYPFGDNRPEHQPLFDKVQITLISDSMLVVPKVDYQPHGYYHIQALLIEEGLYKMYIRLECGSVDYMTMTRQLWLGNDINQLTYSTCYLETRSIVTNVSFSVDGIASRSKESTEYCSSTQAFHGRFHIGSRFNYYDANQHDGDVDFTFQPYGCKLRDTSNSSQLLGLLSDQHIIFLGDSTMEAVYRGILERMYGPNTFIDENNSPEWKSSSSKYSNLPQWTRVSKRWFDFDKNNVRLSFMFDGASELADDWGGAVVEDFTTSTQWEKYRSELRRIIRESIAQCRPITLFFNSGLHDIYSGRNLTGDDSLYVRNLERSVMNLKTMVYEEKSRRLNNVSCPDAAIETHFFWLNTVPPLGVRICGGGIVRYLNQEAAAVVHRYGFRILDIHSFLTGMSFNM